MNKYEQAILELETHCLQKDDEDYNFTYGTYIPYVEHREYSNAVKLLKELVERATPKKITQTDKNVEYYIEYRCPNCESGVEYNEQQFCDVCGQALDWGDTDE